MMEDKENPGTFSIKTNQLNQSNLNSLINRLESNQIQLIKEFKDYIF